MSSNKTILNLKTFTIVLVSFLFCSSLTFAQKKIKASHKIVFVYYENYVRNFILIPNIGKLHTFKIYRKLKDESDTAYKFMVEKEKPALPLRTNSPGVWSVQWEDQDYHSRDVDYKVLAFDKKGIELCQMQIIWEEEKGKKDNQKEGTITGDTLQKF